MDAETSRLLTNVAMDALPAAISLVRDLFHKSNPDAPLLTDADVIGALQDVGAATLAKDAQILREHPE
jgi:hypothetical protein